MESLIPALHQVQEEFRYVPEGAAQLISERWQIPVTDVYNVVTFYTDFRTEPMGTNYLWICEGAACYFMGGPQLAHAAQDRLGIGYNETTTDGKWTLARGDICFGACHLAPLVNLNHELFGPLTEQGIGQLIDNPPEGQTEGHG